MNGKKMTKIIGRRNEGVSGLMVEVICNCNAMIPCVLWCSFPCPPEIERSRLRMQAIVTWWRQCSLVFIAMS